MIRRYKEPSIMNTDRRNRSLTGSSRDTLHRLKGITLIESTKIRWFSR